jgi:hypothetical protein
MKHYYLRILTAFSLLGGNALGATVHYVDINSTNAVPPFTDWSTAATNIQDAVDAADAGETVLVTNGVYQTGGVLVDGLSNRLAVMKAVIVQSVNGPTATIIQGYQAPGATNGPNAVRCVYLTNNTSLIGFTLTNDATYYPWNPSGFQPKATGGGVFCESSSAAVLNCIIIGNSASEDGGGVQGGTLSNCEIVDNVSGFGGGGASESTLNNCWVINPTNALSVLMMLAPSTTVSGIAVPWQSVSGITYFLQRSCSLGVQPAFTSVQSNLLGETGTTVFTDTNAVGQGPFFYRVGVQQ